jgi:hypothetical protein
MISSRYTYSDREKAAQALNISLKHHLAHTRGETVTTPLGSYRGLRIALSTRAGSHPELIISGQSTVGSFFSLRGRVSGGSGGGRAAWGDGGRG